MYVCAQMAQLEEAARRAAITKVMLDQIESLQQERKRAYKAAKLNRVRARAFVACNAEKTLPPAGT